jgi:hypothetical protein
MGTLHIFCGFGFGTVEYVMLTIHRKKPKLRSFRIKLKEI